jgi:hypothetical protein
MEDLLPLFGIAALVLVAGLAVRIAKPGRAKQRVDYPYRKESALFTAAERSFLAVLEQALDARSRVFGKVRLQDLIKVRSGLDSSARQTAYNRIQSKHVDFVVCDPGDLSVQFAIELDDSSHDAPKRKERDKFLDEALAAANLPLYHFRVKRAYSAEDIRRTIFKQPRNTR